MNSSRGYIKVWRFCDAPIVYQHLSEHGGDEDWLAFVPFGIPIPGWADALGCCSVSEHDVLHGTVLIGAHA